MIGAILQVRNRVLSLLLLLLTSSPFVVNAGGNWTRCDLRMGIPYDILTEWKIVEQRVEYLPTPALGIDVPSPRFAWVIEPDAHDRDHLRGYYQESFRITVITASTGQSVWDSGVVKSTESRHVRFGAVGDQPAAPLVSVTAYDWKVQVWIQQQGNETNSDGITVTSDEVRFVTGILDQQEWEDANWLTGESRQDNICRHEFTINNTGIDGQRGRAILLISGLGYFQATLNGARVTDAELEPGWTDYTRRIPYSTYDVTDLLQEGANVLGVALGNGWYATNGGGEPVDDRSRVFIAKLWMEEGPEVITSTADAASWQCTQGPIVYDSLYNGEIYDASIAQKVKGWDTTAFHPRGWTSSVMVPSVNTQKEQDRMVSPKMPAVKKILQLDAVSMHQPKPGIYVVDFGQNIAGRISLTISADAAAAALLQGSKNITIRHAEVLQHEGILEVPEEGMIYTDNLRSARATDVYIWSGDEGRKDREDIVYEPTFTYHGFRYVEVQGYEPRLSDLTAYLMHSDVAHQGSITFSDSLLNQLQNAIHWGQRSNIMSVPTDCPQRDERKGWLGDAQLSGEEALYNFDMVATLIKFLHDIVDTQNEVGQISDTAPFTFGGRPADPSWGSAFPSLLYYLYKETGDLELVEEFYPPLIKYIESLLVAIETSGLPNLYKSYGDWCNVHGTPMCSPHLSGSFSVLENLLQTQALAAATGREDEAKMYSIYHTRLAEVFHSSFFKNGTYDNGVQTCLALPLWANVMPSQSIRQDIENKLLTDLVDVHQYHTTTGIIGLKYMLEVLSQMGRTDVAVTMLQQTDYPSFGFMLNNEYEPATTIWELWDSHTQGPGMNSRNHIMFGGPVGGWFYKYLGGIQPTAGLPDAAGYQEVIVAPPLNPCMALEAVSASIKTLQGPVEVQWTSKLNASASSLQASIYIPVSSKGRIIIDGSKSLRLPFHSESKAGHEPPKSLQLKINGLDYHRSDGMFNVIRAEEDYFEVLVPSGKWDVSVSFEMKSDLTCAALPKRVDLNNEVSVVSSPY